MHDSTKLDHNLKLKLLEAFIFASPEPVKLSLLKQFEDNEDNLFELLDELKLKFQDFGFNLININDYIKFNDNEGSIYVILCNIKFDKKILNNLNLNKLINLNVDEIEKKFIKDYSEIYNLVIIND